jgi:CRP-like cAMP-binding protein
MNSLEGLALLQLHNAMGRWERPTTNDWARVLATFSIFEGVSKRRLRKLVRGASFAEVAAGDRISSNGSHSLYVILGGAARELRGPGAQELGVGDYFGEWAPSVVATQDLHLIKLPAESVVRLARKHPAITLAMLRNASMRLAATPASNPAQ